MSTRKKLVLLLALAAVVITGAGFIAATQYAASALHYQRQLGSPLATIAGLRLYAPWSWLRGTATSLRTRRPSSVRPALSAGSPFSPGSRWFFTAWSRRGGRTTSTAHGSARWADTAELARSGLLDSAGVVLCQTSDARYIASSGPKGQSWRLARPGRLITHNGPEHVIVFAPTRSGKGIGTVVPTLLNWKASALVYDIKKELWTLTAGWRRQFSRCWRFEPTARDSREVQPAARGPPRRRRGARRAEHRRHPRRPRGQEREARPLEDVSLHAPRRHDPPRPLRREGQVAGRRGPRPLQSGHADPRHLPADAEYPAFARRAAPGGRAVRPRNDGQVRQRAGRASSRTAKTLREPVQRPVDRAKHQRVGLPHRRT